MEAYAVAHRQRVGVGLRHRKRRRGNIQRIRRQIGTVCGNRQDNGAATGAEIGESAVLRQIRQSGFYQPLGVGTGDQNVGGDGEAVAPKILLTEKIGKWLACLVSGKGGGIVCRIGIFFPQPNEFAFHDRSDALQYAQLFVR